MAAAVKKFARDDRGISDVLGEVIMVGLVVALAAVLIANVTPLITHHSTRCQMQVSVYRNNVSLMVVAGKVQVGNAILLIQYYNGTTYAILYYYNGRFIGSTPSGKIESLNTVPEIMFPCDYILLHLPSGKYRLTLATRQAVVAQIPVYVSDAIYPALYP